MGEYMRQETRDERIDQEYNRDYVVMRQAEVRLMKKVNNIIAPSCEGNNGWVNTRDRSHMMKESTRNIIVTM